MKVITGYLTGFIINENGTATLTIKMTELSQEQVNRIGESEDPPKVDLNFVDISI